MHDRAAQALAEMDSVDDQPVVARQWRETCTSVDVVGSLGDVDVDTDAVARDVVAARGRLLARAG